MILKIFSILICVIFVGNFLLCYLRSKGKYDEYMEYVDKEEYGLKDFIPLGLLKAESTWTEKIMPMQLKTILASHNNQVYQKVLELHGPKDVEFYYYIHSGYRLAAAILASAMAAIMGMIMSVQGDTSNGALLSVIAIAANFMVPFLVDTSLKESIEKRRRSIQMEFPEFVNKLTLLVVRAVQLPCLLDSLVYILPVIHVDDSLEHEALGLGILLSAHIVLENAVVGTEERQFALQPVLRLLHRLCIVGIHLRDRQFAPNLLDHLPDFRRCNHLVIHRHTVGKHLPLIALAIRVQCYYMLCFCHVISLIKDWFVG